MPRKIQLSEAPPRIQLKILSSECIGDDIYIVRLSQPKASWVPGDCIAVYGPNQSPISRPYSLSGSIKASYLELWVRRFEDGEISNYLCGLRAGDSLEISPPFGWFRPVEPEGAGKIYFATGTGIAPFLSAIRSGSSSSVQIFWGLRHPVELTDPFPVRRFLSKSTDPQYENGRVTRILDEVVYSENTHFYACGLDRMIEEVLGYFSSKGVDESRLHRECFFTGSAAR